MNSSVKRSVLIIDNSPGVTGAFVSMHATTTQLQEEFNFFYAIPVGSSVRAILSDQRVVEIPFLEIQKRWTVLFYIPILFLNAIKLLRYCRKNAIRVIHVNDVYNMVGIVMKLLSPGLRVIYHVRLLPTSYARPLFKCWSFLVCRYADKIICVSNAVLRNFDIPKAILVYDAITPPAARQPRTTNDLVRILYLANYIRGKGHEDAIAAFAIALRSSERRMHLTFAGGDLGFQKNADFKNQLITMVSDAQVKDNVTFLGRIDDIDACFADTDIFLNFSYSESFSMTCLEALMRGVPVIATDSGGPAELFENGVSGVLVQVGNIDGMAKAIVQLAEDNNLRKTMGNNAKSYTQRKFALTASAAQLKEIYFASLNIAGDK